MPSVALKFNLDILLATNFLAVAEAATTDFTADAIPSTLAALPLTDYTGTPPRDTCSGAPSKHPIPQRSLDCPLPVYSHPEPPLTPSMISTVPHLPSPEI